MTKEQLVSAVAKNGNSTQVKDFGGFNVKPTKATTRRNLQTGQPIEVPASHRVTFKPATALKAAVAGIRARK